VTLCFRENAQNPPKIAKNVAYPYFVKFKQCLTFRPKIKNEFWWLFTFGILKVFKQSPKWRKFASHPAQEVAFFAGLSRDR
jgi:hypothetical protein